MHLREAKDGDGKPWPELTGEQPYDHPDNEARETARKELERDFITPDYTEIVGATVGHIMSTAAETAIWPTWMSTFIFLSHAVRGRRRSNTQWEGSRRKRIGGAPATMSGG